jgi:cleavage and polyadenylation specificity factor subunit 4
MATVTTSTNLHTISDNMLNPQPTNTLPTFTFTPFLQRTYQHSLPPNRPICKTYATTGTCPYKTHCLERHVSTPASHPSNSSQTPFGSLVCKHWLRGLCKKGDACEFLHEYNLRKMPECNFFLRNGYCSNGDECLYLHIDPESKGPGCEWYERGFCPLGPRCAKRHVKRKMCPYYLCGFCPDGRRDCKEGVHPRWFKDEEMERPKVRVERTKEEEEERLRIKEEEYRERERLRDERMGGDGGYGDRGGHRGRGGRWRGKRGGGFRGGGGGARH